MTAICDEPDILVYLQRVVAESPGVRPSGNTVLRSRIARERLSVNQSGTVNGPAVRSIADEALHHPDPEVRRIAAQLKEATQ